VNPQELHWGLNLNPPFWLVLGFGVGQMSECFLSMDIIIPPQFAIRLL
jgi:hypothetical protein